MSYAEYQQYYLRSMGIDVYVGRASYHDTEQSAATSQTTAADKPTLIITPQKLQECGLFVDVCRYFAVDAANCELVQGCRLQLKGVHWRFDLDSQSPEMTVQEIVSKPPHQLTRVSDKKALWQSIWQLTEQNEDD